ncbi:MAG: hypothetical protein Kow0063_41230 [Anaerolineae bacterium]
MKPISPAWVSPGSPLETTFPEAESFREGRSVTGASQLAGYEDFRNLLNFGSLTKNVGQTRL